MQFAIPRARVPQRLPDILSREEIERLFAAANLLKHRVLLMTTYAAGLRVSAVCALKVTDIDSGRMRSVSNKARGVFSRWPARLTLATMRPYLVCRVEARAVVFLGNYPVKRLSHEEIRAKRRQSRVGWGIHRAFAVYGNTPRLGLSLLGGLHKSWAAAR